MNRLIEMIKIYKLDGNYIKYLNYLKRQALIILDDFSLQPMNQDVKLALLQIMEDRYAKIVIIVTFKLPIWRWYEYINEPTLADDVMNRMTANAHRIKLKEESRRNKKIIPQKPLHNVSLKYKSSYNYCSLIRWV